MQGIWLLKLKTISVARANKWQHGDGQRLWNDLTINIKYLFYWSLGQNGKQSVCSTTTRYSAYKGNSFSCRNYQSSITMSTSTRRKWIWALPVRILLVSTINYDEPRLSLHSANAKVLNIFSNAQNRKLILWYRFICWYLLKLSNCEMKFHQLRILNRIAHPCQRRAHSFLFYVSAYHFSSIWTFASLLCNQNNANAFLLFSTTSPKWKDVQKTKLKVEQKINKNFSLGRLVTDKKYPQQRFQYLYC